MQTFASFNKEMDIEINYMFFGEPESSLTNRPWWEGQNPEGLQLRQRRMGFETIKDNSQGNPLML